MNRRSFIKGLIGIAILPFIKYAIPIEPVYESSYEDYITLSFKLYCDNPSACAVITNIGIEE